MKVLHILLVEDNDGDILLIKESLAEAGMTVELSIVKDGMAATDFLNNENRYVYAEEPDLVLLDINLPKRNGHEVLKFIKESERLKHIPVAIFTTSSAGTDISRCYRNHANCYITKPVNVNDFMRVVAATVNFWIAIARLPAKAIKMCS